MSYTCYSYINLLIFLAITYTSKLHGFVRNLDYNNLKWAAQVIYVDQFGRGDYRSIQRAIDGIYSNNSRWKIIRIKPGIYEEKIVVPSDKSHLILSGFDAKRTIIRGNLGGGIRTSSTVTVFASNFVATNITFENTYGAGTQAVALKVMGDKVVFEECRILGYQDTLLDERGRHYYKNCYIQGAIDFICGNAASLFHECHIHSITSRYEKGAITAQRRSTWEENTGFYFTYCNITGTHGCTLGRPWGNYSRVVFSNTHMSSAVLPGGWNDWNKPFTHSTVYYGEHNCYGLGANRSRRVPWSRHLTYDQALSPLWFLD